MLVRDFMQQDLPVIDEEAIVADAVHLMHDSHTPAISVVDSAGNLVGIISERDILINLVPDDVAVRPYLRSLNMSAERWLPQYRDLLKVYGDKVKEVMTREVIAVSEDDTVERAAEILIEAEKRQLPVVRNGKPVGMIDRLDLIKAFAPNQD